MDKFEKIRNIMFEYVWKYADKGATFETEFPREEDKKAVDIIVRSVEMWLGEDIVMIAMQEGDFDHPDCYEEEWEKIQDKIIRRPFYNMLLPINECGWYSMGFSEYRPKYKQKRLRFVKGGLGSSGQSAIGELYVRAQDVDKWKEILDNFKKEKGN